MKRIYLDYAATTPLDPRVLRVMKPFFTTHFGNPSALYEEGVSAKKAVDAARARVARTLEAHSDEIVFTSGGTEANNLALLGIIQALRKTASSKVLGNARFARSRHFEDAFRFVPHIVTTNIEHSSVLEPLCALVSQGRAVVSFVPVEANGIVSPAKILKAVRPNTALVSVMHANNEIGTIQAIAQIGKLLKMSRRDPPLFHTDACQAPLFLNCLVNYLGVDLMSFDGHKMYGPKGVGALYLRRGTPITPILRGGGQERGLRPTTENVASIVGFAEALRLALVARTKESLRVARLRDELHTLIRANKKTSDAILLNGDMKERLPNNLNISLSGIDTEMFVLQLDAAGIAVSTKSSCLRDERESYVVAALGGAPWRAASSLRFSLGRGTTLAEVREVARAFARSILSVSWRTSPSNR